MPFAVPPCLAIGGHQLAATSPAFCPAGRSLSGVNGPARADLRGTGPSTSQLPGDLQRMAAVGGLQPV